MTDGGTNVRPPRIALTEHDAREILARPILAACSTYGPTAIGATIGCDEKTVRNARDEKTTLRLDFAVNMLDVDPHALDGFLARVGRRSVPIGSVCDTDHDRVKGSAVLKAALALSVALEDDETITAREVVAMRPTLESARAAIDAVLAKLTAKAA